VHSVSVSVLTIVTGCRIFRAVFTSFGLFAKFWASRACMMLAMPFASSPPEQVTVKGTTSLAMDADPFGVHAPPRGRVRAWLMRRVW
jgi:hypothetical protein